MKIDSFFFALLVRV